jgi:hypothetical protein
MYDFSPKVMRKENFPMRNRMYIHLYCKVGAYYCRQSKPLGKTKRMREKRLDLFEKTVLEF